MLNKYTTEKIKCQQLFKIFCFLHTIFLQDKMQAAPSIQFHKRQADALFQNLNEIVDSLKNRIRDFIQMFLFLQRSQILTVG